jgi:hypothetical protein
MAGILAVHIIRLLTNHHPGSPHTYSRATVAERQRDWTEFYHGEGRWDHDAHVLKTDHGQQEPEANDDPGPHVLGKEAADLLNPPF